MREQKFILTGGQEFHVECKSRAKLEFSVHDDINENPKIVCKEVNDNIGAWATAKTMVDGIEYRAVYTPDGIVNVGKHGNPQTKLLPNNYDDEFAKTINDALKEYAQKSLAKVIKIAKLEAAEDFIQKNNISDEFGKKMERLNKVPVITYSVLLALDEKLDVHEIFSEKEWEIFEKKQIKEFFYDIRVIKEQMQTFMIEAKNENEAIEQLDELYNQFLNGERELDPLKFSIEIETESRDSRDFESEKDRAKIEKYIPEITPSEAEIAPQIFNVKISETMESVHEVEAGNKKEALETAKGRYEYNEIGPVEEFSEKKATFEIIPERKLNFAQRLATEAKNDRGR